MHISNERASEWINEEKKSDKLGYVHAETWELQKNEHIREK